MKIGSATIAAFMSVIVIFSGAQRRGDSFDFVTVHAANDQQQRQNDQKKNEAPAQKKRNEDDVTVRVDTTLVTVPVVAMDRAGKFVPGLTKEDFSVYEEGVKQDITFFLSAEEPITVALMLDVSDSAESNLEKIKAAAIAFVDQLRPDDRVTALSFDGGLHQLTPITGDHDAIRGAINSAQSGRGTLLYESLDFTLTKLLNPGPGRKAIILFTDGVDVGSRITMEKSMRTVEEAGIFIYSIHYKHPQNTTAPPEMIFGAPTRQVSYKGDQRMANFYLRGIAKSTGGGYYMAEGEKGMEKSFASIAEELRKRYDLGYYPTEPAKPGQKVKIKVKAEKPNVAVRARDSYVYSPQNADK